MGFADAFVENFLPHMVTAEGLKYAMGELQPPDNQNQTLDPSAFGTQPSPFMPQDQSQSPMAPPQNQNQMLDPSAFGTPQTPGLNALAPISDKSGGASNPKTPTSADAKQSSNLMETAMKFFSNPLVQGGIGALGGGLGSNYRTTQRQKFGNAIMGGMQGYNQAQQDQEKQANIQQQQQQQQAQQAQQAAYQQHQMKQGDQQLKLKQDELGWRSPEQNQQYVEAAKQMTGDKNLQTAMMLTNFDVNDPMAIPRALQMRKELDVSDVQEARLENARTKLAAENEKLQWMKEEKLRADQRDDKLYALKVSTAIAQIESAHAKAGAALQKEENESFDRKNNGATRALDEWDKTHVDLSFGKPNPERDAARAAAGEIIADRFKLKINPVTGLPPGQAAPAGGGGGASGAPAVGAVIKGYRFKGGDPSQQTSWEKAS